MVCILFVFFRMFPLHTTSAHGGACGLFCSASALNQALKNSNILVERFHSQNSLHQGYLTGEYSYGTVIIP
jgi:hypothetical protein